MIDNSAIDIKHELNELVCKLRSILSKKTIEKISTESCFQKRSSARFTGYDFLLSLLSVSMDSEYTTLERISSTLARLRKSPAISPQAIMERLNKQEAVTFLQRIQELVLKSKIAEFTDQIPSGLLDSFTKVLIQDSTVFELNEKLQEFFKGSGGRASKSCGKLDVIYDIKSLTYENIYLTDQSEADSALAKNIDDFVSEGSLVIRDLAYMQTDAIEKIIQKKAFFLGRFKLNFLVYKDVADSESIDLAKYLSKKLEYQSVVDEAVYITKKKIPLRLVAYKCPEEIVAKRRRAANKTAKKQGRKLKSRTTTLMGFTIFITNVPQETWKPEVVGTVYRARWQIETLFKRWKSGMKINYLKGTNQYRIKVLIYSRLISLLIINMVCQVIDYLTYKKYKREVSMDKIHQWMKEGDRMIRFIQRRALTWEFSNLGSLILKCMCKDKRKRLTTREMLQQEVAYG